MAESVFETVKQSITVREAAQMYGIEVNRSGMACCPFHGDKSDPTGCSMLRGLGYVSPSASALTGDG